MIHKILFFSRHDAQGFSGGRLHSWMMCEALASLGHEVTVITNNFPQLAEEFLEYPSHDKINVVRSENFSGWEEIDYSIIVVVPDLSPSYSVFGQALLAWTLKKVPLVFLDFESPDWFNRTSGFKRGLLNTLGWRITGSLANIVISSTKIGRDEAKKTYARKSRGAQQYVVCQPPINDLALSPLENCNFEKRQVVCIARRNKKQSHKDSDMLLDLVSWLPKGYTLSCIGSIDEQFQAQLENASVRYGIKLDLRQGLSDVGKFLLMAESNILIFSSKFEGFGLPPIEAMCAGTRCIVSDLPVLRENLCFSDTIFADTNDRNTMKTIISEELSKFDTIEERAERQSTALEKYSFSAYCARLSVILDSINLVKYEQHVRFIPVKIVARLINLWSSSIIKLRRRRYI